MPETEIKFYRDSNGNAPVLTWLRELKEKQPSVFAKCNALLQELARRGFELQRPAADFLRDGIYELRTHDEHTQFRILYFFDKRGRNIAIVAHSFRKESTKQQDKEIDRACRRRVEFLENPDAHTFDQIIEKDK